MGTISGRSSTRSLASAGGLIGGLIAGQVAPCPQIGAACALVGLSLAAPARWRVVLLPPAIGLLLSWSGPGHATRLPPTIVADRPLVATVRQVAGWLKAADGWHTTVDVELLRQGGRTAAWGATLRLYVPSRLPGSRWRVRGRLGRAEPLGNGGPSRSRPWRLATKSGRLVERLPDPRLTAGVARRLRRLRSRALRRVETAGEATPGRALARALVLGDPAALPESLVRGLRRSGLAHVTALSGLHLGVLAAWCAAFTRRAPPVGRWTAVAILTLAYLCLGGARPSLLRSWLMVGAAGTAALSRRSARSLHALAWSAAGLAALEPTAVRDLGFQLTFAASAGVILGARVLPRLWSPVLGSLARPLGATLGAQVATTPLTLLVFHWLPAWAWLWNLLLVPVVATTLPVAFVWVAVALVDPVAAGRAILLLDGLAYAISLPAQLPAGVLGGMPWGGRPLAAAVLAAAGGCGLLRPGRLLRAVLCLALLSGPSPGPTADRTVVHVLDVGQGDALLLRDGGGALLVDGGGWQGSGIAEAVLLPTLGRLGLRELEVAVLTHGDRDHCRGLVELAGYVPIREVWLSSAAASSVCGRQLMLTPGLRLRPLWAGVTVDWRGWRVAVLNPRPGERGGNEQSLVLRGSSRGRSLMLTGDVGHRTEFAILTRTSPAEIKADLLKVAHHGSSGSSSLSFVRAVAPVLALVSAGRRNPFGHPARGVLERLSGEGALLLRTDLTGQVEVSWGSGTRLRIGMPGSPW